MKTILSILTLILSATAGAQSFQASVSGSATVYAIQSLTLTGGSIIPNFTSFEHYLNGVEVKGYLNIGVKSNKAWTLSVKAQNAHFSPMSAGGSTNMPSSVLSVKPSTSSDYKTISTTSQTIKTGNKGDTNASGNAFQLDIRYNPGFSYKGGIYTLGLIYTLSQQ